MKQHTQPCGDCPFMRSIRPGACGGSAPQVYVGQSEGPFMIACHSVPEYSQSEPDQTKFAQCAGLAIYRANIRKAHLMPKQLLQLPADRDKCFASHAEFLSHHLRISLEQAKQYLEIHTPEELMIQQMTRKTTRFISKDSELC